MRNYIFEFEQQVAMRLGLNLKELLFLDYILQFVNSGNMRSKRVEGKYYFMLTYKKIIDDLPILKIKERQLRNMITRLEKMHLVERLSELKVEEVKDGYVLLSVTNVKYVGKDYGEQIKFAIEKSLKSLVENN